jgi:hypothetical protein
MRDIEFTDDIYLAYSYGCVGASSCRRRQCKYLPLSLISRSATVDFGYTHVLQMLDSQHYV